MRTTDQKIDDIDEAEREMIKICKKYRVSLAPLYDEGVSIEIIASDEYPSGDYSVVSREIEL